jgi:hypothetical protein
VAIVRRGWERGYPIDLPRVGAFNHAIVYAEDEAGKAYWIDPTNPSSYARGKRPDIAGRPALVLTRETETKGLSEIPSIKPSDMRYYSRYEYWPVSLNARKVVFQFRAFGSGALDLSGRELRESRERIEREMLEWVTDSSEILRAKMDPFDLSSRIVKDIQIQGEVEHKWVPTRSTAGLGHQISQSFYGLQRVILKERNAGYHLGIPYRKEDEYVFKESRLVGQPLRECKIDSPWLYAERLIEQRENDIHVRNVIEKRQVGISLADLKSEKMREVRQKLRTCFGSMTMIYTLPDRLMTDVPMDEEEETLAH